MKMKQTEIIKGRGIKRKTSLGLVCGISLMGALFLGANGVSADEVTPTTPTTATASESKTVVVDEGLTETANKAKEAGLTVNAEPTKNIGTANTEEEATKLAEQAKKEVADQKAQIEKETADYQKAKSESGNQEKEIVKSIVNQPTAYLDASNGLQYLEDKDFIAGKTSLGTVASNKGSVSYVAPSTTSVMMDDPATMRKFIENSQSGTTPTEMTIGYNEGNMLVSTSPIANKKTATKVVPVFLKEGEIVNYDVNVTPDSELGSLGIAKIQKSYSLDKSPAKNGKVVAFLSQQGSTQGQLLIGGSGKAVDDLKEGEWTYTVAYKYYDKNGKVIPTNELFAKYANKYLLKGKELVKPSDVTKKPEVSEAPYPYEGNGFEKVKQVNVYGGAPTYFIGTETEKISGLAGIKPVYYVGQHGALAPTPVDTSKLAPNAPAKTVNYHLVSYTVNKAKATNNTDKLKKGSIVQVFIEEGGKEIAPKTNTGEKPVDETVTLNHPKEILFEGKTYTFTKQDKADPTKIPNGQETITYIYKLKETPKPVVVEEKKGDVEVRYVKDDASRTVLKEPVADTVGGKVGSDYDTTDNKPKTITKDGVTYEYVRSEGVEKGKVVEGKTVVTYVYREVPKPTPTPTPTPNPAPVEDPTTIHIDEDGNRIAPPEKGTKPFKNIDGYEPSPKNPKNVENPKGETVRVYKIVKGDVEVRYIKDDKERTVLKEPVADTTQAKVGTKYDTTDHKPVTITKDGVTYELVRTEGKETGDVVKGKTVVTYVYREVQKPVTIHIDKEGNPVAPKEDGTKPFKDIEGYKPEPKDPKNVEDPKGVTVRVYEKVTPKPETPKTPETPQTPNTPEAPKPQPQQPTQAVVKATLPQTGEVASLALTLAGLGLLGLSGLVTKKRED
jgi:LPXTG-motif cell wall-anchored protein